ncbi:NAD(P)-binding domain-containing protein, partial [Planctomycetota bacterium]|nr:NAD(P)-binding domain-containing protein [Planctomycetota bacterium]
MLTTIVWITAACVVVLIVVVFAVGFRREEKAREILAESLASGANQPASLHPVIDLEACMSSGACIDVCPEAVLGSVAGVTQMVQANNCIGHGRCKDSCPVDAINLVFGTSERGMDIPMLRKGYQTNVDGIYIVGELGGMGLLKNTMKQGMQVVASLKKALKGDLPKPKAGAVDVVIVGGGPAGIACAAQCVDDGLSYVLLEQDSLGGSITHYPRRKLIFTEVIKLPVVGKFGKREMLKEELIAELEQVMLKAGIDLQEGVRVTGVTGKVGRFKVQAERGAETVAFDTRLVVLA